jgi:hypothetical protein
MSTKTYRVIPNFVKIGAVKAILYIPLQYF